MERSRLTDDAQEPEPEIGPLQWVSVDTDDCQQVHLLDCRSIALTMMSTTQDADVAASFSHLRVSDGRQHVGQMPPDPTAIDCLLEYEGWPLREGPLFKADEMEDKWDIYQWNGQLYAVRSWTDDLIITADLSVQGTNASIRRIVAAADRVFGDAAFAVRTLDFLIESHVFGRECPHPLPAAYLGRAPDDLALFSFSQFGRRGLYGIFAGA